MLSGGSTSKSKKHKKSKDKDKKKKSKKKRHERSSGSRSDRPTTADSAGGTSSSGRPTTAESPESPVYKPSARPKTTSALDDDLFGALGGPKKASAAATEAATRPKTADDAEAELEAMLLGALSGEAPKDDVGASAADRAPLASSTDSVGARGAPRGRGRSQNAPSASTPPSTSAAVRSPEGNRDDGGMDDSWGDLDTDLPGVDDSPAPKPSVDRSDDGEAVQSSYVPSSSSGVGRRGVKGRGRSRVADKPSVGEVIGSGGSVMDTLFPKSGASSTGGGANKDRTAAAKDALARAAAAIDDSSEEEDAAFQPTAVDESETSFDVHLKAGGGKQGGAKGTDKADYSFDDFEEESGTFTSPHKPEGPSATERDRDRSPRSLRPLGGSSGSVLSHTSSHGSMAARTTSAGRMVGEGIGGSADAAPGNAAAGGVARHGRRSRDRDFGSAVDAGSSVPPRPKPTPTPDLEGYGVAATPAAAAHVPTREPMSPATTDQARRLQDVVAERDAALESSQATVNALRADLSREQARHAEEIASLRADLEARIAAAESQAKVAAIRAESRDLEASASLDSRTGVLEARVRELEAAVATKNDQIERERAAHKEAIESAQRLADSRVADLKREAEVAQAAHTRALDAARSSAFSEASSSLDAEVQSLRQRVRELERERTEAEMAHRSALTAAVSEARTLEGDASAARVREAVAAAEARAREELGRKERQYREEIKEIRRLHQEEVEAISRREQDGRALAELTSQVSQNVSHLDELRSKVAADQAATVGKQMAQLEVRERLVKQLEDAARATEARADDEVRRLQALLASMEKTLRDSRTSTEEDRVRLREEHARLEAMQTSLRAESDVLRADVAEDRKRLADERSTFEAHRRSVMADLSAAREAAEAERATADRERIEMRHEREAADREVAAERARVAEELERVRQEARSLEKESKVALEKSAVLAREREALQAERRALELEKAQFAQEANRLTTMASALQKQSAVVAEEREKAAEERQRAQQLRNETASLQVSASSDRRAVDGTVRQLQEERKRLMQARLELAEQRKIVSAERAESARLSAEARSMHMALVERLGQLGMTAPANYSMPGTAASAGGVGGGGDARQAQPAGVSGDGSYGGQWAATPAWEESPRPAAAHNGQDVEPGAGLEGLYDRSALNEQLAALAAHTEDTHMFMESESKFLHSLHYGLGAGRGGRAHDTRGGGGRSAPPAEERKDGTVAASATGLGGALSQGGKVGGTSSGAANTSGSGIAFGGRSRGGGGAPARGADVSGSSIDTTFRTLLPVDEADGTLEYSTASVQDSTLLGLDTSQRKPNPTPGRPPASSGSAGAAVASSLAGSQATARSDPLSVSLDLHASSGAASSDFPLNYSTASSTQTGAGSAGDRSMNPAR